MEDLWQLREYKPGDEQGIHALYRLVFDIELDDRQWSWKYLHNPTGLVKIAIAEAGDRIVGQYAVLPVKMKMQDKILIAALSLDTMVHPKYRGHGMFIELATFLYKRVKEDGVTFIYGFPNESSHHGFVSKLGWFDLYKRIPLFVRPLDVKSILSKKTGNAFLSTIGGWIGSIGLPLYSETWAGMPDGYSTKQIAFFDKRFDVLWKRASSTLDIALVRNCLYLNWRYVDKPGSGYMIFVLEKDEEILGYVVLESLERFGLKIGFIVDLLAVSGKPDIGKCLVYKAVEHFKQIQSSMICCLMPKKSPYLQALKTNGFMYLPTKLHPQKMYLGAFCNAEEYSKEFIANSDNWYITWGDHDDI